jgi:hypothetical protein
MRWARHMARTGKGRGGYIIVVGNLREGDQLKYLGVENRIILVDLTNRLGKGGLD